MLVWARCCFGRKILGLLLAHASSFYLLRCRAHANAVGGIDQLPPTSSVIIGHTKWAALLINKASISLKQLMNRSNHWRRQAMDERRDLESSCRPRFWILSWYLYLALANFSARAKLGAVDVLLSEWNVLRFAKGKKWQSLKNLSSCHCKKKRRHFLHNSAHVCRLQFSDCLHRRCIKFIS